MADLLNNILNQNVQTRPAQPLPAIKLDLNSQTKIQPLNPKGRMLKSQIIGSPIEYAKDMKQDILGIKKGIKGQANDHELGKMNDLAMKLGSLGIAGYLFAKNPFKMKRTMEFVGFGTFFASMALWPKLAIQAPLKARTGVDIHQKYEDSYGRKKMFFQDPQYIPWDLVSKEELNKMADRLGVPKDIKNRDEVTKLQAQKIAVQGNTLWMMTAGLATPVMSALACNVAEKLILPRQEEAALKNTEAHIDELNEVLSKSKDKDFDVLLKELSEGFKDEDAKIALNSFLTENASQPLNDDNLSKLSKLITNQADPLVVAAVKKDLIARASDATKPLDESFAQKLFDANKALFEGFGISADDVNVKLNAILNPVGAAAEEGAEAVASKQATQIVIDKKNIKKFTTELFESLMEGKKIKASQLDTVEETFAKGFMSAVEKHNVLTVGDISAKAETFFGLMDEMFAQRRIVDNYLDARIGDRAESFIANKWGKINQEFIKALNLSKDDVKGLALNPHYQIGDKEHRVSLVATKLNELAASKKYDATIKKLSKLVDEYVKELSDETFVKKALEGTTGVLNLNGIKLAEAGFENAAESIIGKPSKGLTSFVPGSMKNAVRRTVGDRINGAKYSFYRMIQTLDLFKKIQSGSLVGELKCLENANLDGIKLNEFLKILKGEFIDFGAEKYASLQTGLKSAFNIEYSMDKPVATFRESLEVLNDKGKADWLITISKRFAANEISESDLINIFKRELKDYKNPELLDDTLKNAKTFAEAIGNEWPVWNKVIKLLEISSKSSDMDAHMTKGFVSELCNRMASPELIEKCKKVLINYHITDHTEKLNGVGPDEYNKIMKLLFATGMDSTTERSVKNVSDNLLTGINKYKAEFISKIGNWHYWDTETRFVDAGSKHQSMDSLTRHILVGSSVDDMLAKASDNLHHTNKWLRRFGGGFAVLTGVTLLSGLFFGKMKQEDVYAGGNK